MSQGMLAASRSWKEILPNSLQKECNLPGGALISVLWDSWQIAMIQICKIDIFGIRVSQVVQQSRIRLQCWSQKRCSFDSWVRKIPWKRAWQPTPIFLPRESYGQRSLASYSPWGHRVGHDWSELACMDICSYFQLLCWWWLEKLMQWYTIQVTPWLSRCLSCSLNSSLSHMIGLMSFSLNFTHGSVLFSSSPSYPWSHGYLITLPDFLTFQPLYSSLARYSS